jgi:hypothetical protein
VLCIHATGIRLSFWGLEQSIVVKWYVSVGTEFVDGIDIKTDRWIKAASSANKSCSKGFVIAGGQKNKLSRRIAPIISKWARTLNTLFRSIAVKIRKGSVTEP